MTTSPPLAVLSFLPPPPIRLPAHEPRKSGVTPYRYLSDKQPVNAEGHPGSELYPFPQGKEVKWLTAHEITAYLVTQGYDQDVASSANTVLQHFSYYRLYSYYMHKEQARRNKARELARLKAEKLVGTQAPPEQTPPEGD